MQSQQDKVAEQNRIWHQTSQALAEEARRYELLLWKKLGRSKPDWTGTGQTDNQEKKLGGTT